MAEKVYRAKDEQMKVLILRFSSIGDIILTTPIIRCLKQQRPQIEIHFLTKDTFQFLLASNPYIQQLHTFKEGVDEVIPSLKGLQFDLIIDLHHNLRTARIKQALNCQAVSFNKLNIAKFFAVGLKQRKILPAVHIVDRYFETVKSLGIINDGLPLDYYANNDNSFHPFDRFKELNNKAYFVIVAGGSYFTKQIPNELILKVMQEVSHPVILLGDKKDRERTNDIMTNNPNVINACGLLSFDESAIVIKHASAVVTSDTGLMHVASAFNKIIFSIWGNTIPEFGMSPYLPAKGSQIFEANGLSCRPCSKLGFNACPAQHFNCMHQINWQQLSQSLNEVLNS